MNTAWDNWINLNKDAINNGKIERADTSIYRIDLATPKVFTPRLPKSTLSGECESIPRICASRTIADAMVGYNKLVADAYSYMCGNIDNITYEISALKVPEIFSPSDSLVPNAGITNEVWVVNYNGQYNEVTPDIIGTINIYNIAIKPDIDPHDRISTIEISFVIQNASNEVISIADGKKLNEGYGCGFIRIDAKIAGVGNMIPANVFVGKFREIDVTEWVILSKRKLDIQHYAK